MMYSFILVNLYSAPLRNLLSPAMAKEIDLRNLSKEEKLLRDSMHSIRR